MNQQGFRKLTRIGVFYDGNYFLHVSNYYNYVHDKRRRLSIEGLHAFIRRQVSEKENADERHCQVVDAHYFRGRLNAVEANQRPNQLYFERVFDDILMSAGVTTHYLPVKSKNGRREEKGIDVWLALEALDLAMHNKYDVIVLITSDGDYVPLVRKLNTLGVRVMALTWDFAYTDDNGRSVETRTSQDLLDEVTYPIAMYEIIDNRANRNDMIVNNLFVPERTVQPQRAAFSERRPATSSGQRFSHEEEQGHTERSVISALKNGFGFIEGNPDNIFFHYTELNGVDFNELREGDEVEFFIGTNPNGGHMAKNIRLIDEGSGHDEQYYEGEEDYSQEEDLSFDNR